MTSWPPMPAGIVRRALPRIGGEWADVAGQVTAFLLDRAAEAPSTHLPALQAWDRLDAEVRPAQSRSSVRPGVPYADLVFVSVDVADIAAVKTAALDMAGQGSGYAAPVAEGAGAGVVTLRPVGLAGRPQCELARVHGVLDLDLGRDGEILREWGADGPLFARPPGEALAAQRRIAARVYAIWKAHGR